MICGNEDCGREKEQARRDVHDAQTVLRDCLPYVLNAAKVADEDGNAARARRARGVIERAERALGIPT